MTDDRRLEFLFVRTAWRVGPMSWLVFFLVALAAEYGLKLIRANDVAARWGVDELPIDYWFSILPIVLVAHLGRMAWRRLIRSPKLTLDEDKIRASFSASPAQEVLTDRVTEIQVDEERSLVRFFVPDGLSLAVQTDLLETQGAGPIDLAHRFAHVLDVPVVPVRYRLWGWRRVDVSSTPV